MKKTIKTSVVIAVYNAINSAKLTKLTDIDKFKVIRMARSMKDIASGFNDFTKDAQEKLKDERFDIMVEKAQQWQREGENTTLTEEERVAVNRYFSEYNKKVDECVRTEADKNVDIEFELLTEEAFMQLAASNDWTCGQIIELEDLVCKE